MTENPENGPRVAPSGPFWLAVAGALLICGAALIWARLNVNQPTSEVAPNFTLVSYDGTSYQLSHLRGKVIVLHFWATWCGPCRSEATGYEELWSYFKDSNVVFLGIDQEDKPDDARAFIHEYSLGYPNGPDTDMVSSYRVQGLPTTIIVDQNGLVAARILAAADPNDLQSRIEALLNKPT